jgi:haloacid dehalogenase superfamily, subfamily IA, variant 1 with third motif having Dx(3-4)D or Dx(3-4)E
MEAIGFDLGDTLIYYHKVPLSWTDLYENALAGILHDMELGNNEALILEATNILKKYNTRLNPRDYEVTDIDIFREIHQAWDINKDVEPTIHRFFSYFQQESRVFEDTIPILKYLKERDIKVGILTDVPYGMSRELVLKDIEEFKQYIDIVITSVDVGHRKPRSEGFIQLASQLECSPERMSYVGNESKDIQGAKLSGMKGILINRTLQDVNWDQDLTITKLNEIEELYKQGGSFR